MVSELFGTYGLGCIRGVCVLGEAEGSASSPPQGHMHNAPISRAASVLHDVRSLFVGACDVVSLNHRWCSAPVADATNCFVTSVRLKPICIQDTIWSVSRESPPAISVDSIVHVVDNSRQVGLSEAQALERELLEDGLPQLAQVGGTRVLLLRDTRTLASA